MTLSDEKGGKKMILFVFVGKKNRKKILVIKEERNVRVFYSLRSPLRFLSFSARAFLSASRRVILRTSHSSVLVANLV